MANQKKLYPNTVAPTNTTRLLKNSSNRARTRPLYLATFSFLTSTLLTQGVEFPPAIGSVGPETEAQAHYQLIFEEDFEGDLSQYNIGAIFQQITNTPDVIEDEMSLQLEANSAIEISNSILNLESLETYLFEFKYSTSNPTPDAPPVVLGLSWPGFTVNDPGAVGGPINGVSPSAGTFRYTMRIGNTEEAELLILALDPLVTIDSLKIYQLVTRFSPPEPKPFTAGFPRLCNFHVYNAGYGGTVNGTLAEETLAHLSLYDFVNGIPYGHTHGPELEFLTLKHKNPNLKLVPYVQSYMAVLEQTEPIANSANMLGFFNQGLEEAWFMRDTNGEKLNEPLYPTNYQMNHTQFAKPVEGVSFIDYQTQFLRDSLIGSGLWDGIHFDQSEWLTNSLLGTDSPFTGGEVNLPPIDLNEDGIAETEEELGAAWRAAFAIFFDEVRKKLGPSPLIFGNSGVIPRDPEVLRRFNGLQNEFFTPFQILANGDWLTTGTGGWHRFYETSERAAKHLQHPQIVGTQLTGYRLGTLNGKTTENGLADREPQLENRDYRRIRFGLTSSLLTNGFFSYDFIDNTTSPILWFDEYSVNSNGVAEQSMQAKGYLGQPLDEAVELDYAAETIFELNFEPTEELTRPGLFVNPAVTIITDPSEVIDGSGSARLNFTSLNDEGAAILATEFSSPGSERLEVGATYQVFVDYHLRNVNESASGAVFAIGVTDFDTVGDNVLFETNNIYVSDIDGELKGSLRSAAKISSADAFASVLTLKDQVATIDRFKLIKGNGGVYRRDFEHGIILVNPTPESATVSLSEIEGPLTRSNIKRIQGSQQPSWNNGSPVTGSLILPSGDGIILLADSIERMAPEPPTNIEFLNITESTSTISFTSPELRPSGYKIRYGLEGGDLTSFQLIGTEPNFTIRNLLPGSNYLVELYSMDFAGNFSENSVSSNFTTSGSIVTERPMISAGSQPLIAGTEIQLSASLPGVSSNSISENNLPTSLEGVSFFINGIPVGLRSVSSTEVTLHIPPEIASGISILRVEVNGQTSPSLFSNIQQTNEEVTLSNFSVSENETNLTWKTQPSKKYTIESSSDLQKWIPRHAIEGISSSETHKLRMNNNIEREFFRIRED